MLRSSDNISRLLTLLINHEQNVKNHFRRNNVIQFVFERGEREIEHTDIERGERDIENTDISNNDLNIDITNVSYRAFHELENRNEITCSITQELFNPDDNVALLQCGHFFKKDAFLTWSRRSRMCPICRVPFIP